MPDWVAIIEALPSVFGSHVTSTDVPSAALALQVSRLSVPPAFAPVTARIPVSHVVITSRTRPKSGQVCTGAHLTDPGMPDRYP